jgi:hypothetical protein
VLTVHTDDGTIVTLPGPYSDIATIWHGDNSGDDYGVSGVTFTKDASSSNLVITAKAFNEDSWKGSTYRGDTYFCYSINKAYHWA